VKRGRPPAVPGTVEAELAGDGLLRLGGWSGRGSSVAVGCSGGRPQARGRAGRRRTPAPGCKSPRRWHGSGSRRRASPVRGRRRGRERRPRAGGRARSCRRAASSEPEKLFRFGCQQGWPAAKRSDCGNPSCFEQPEAASPRYRSGEMHRFTTSGRWAPPPPSSGSTMRRGKQVFADADRGPAPRQLRNRPGRRPPRRRERPDPHPALPRKEERVLARFWLTPTARFGRTAPWRDERIPRERSSRPPRSGRAQWRPSASPASGGASCDGVGLLTTALLLRHERGHRARADRGFRSGRAGITMPRYCFSVEQ
jgi:hypothetical protein